jgi:ankyrin repeat protein
MTRPIPSRPSLDKDRKAAKALKKAHADGAPEALARIRAHHPRLRGKSDAEIAAAPFRLSDAQLVVAREYGLESWPRWKALADFLCADFAARVRLFLEAALDEDPRRSHELLAHAPELARADLHTAGAAGDEARAREILARDPAAATRRGGPCDAEPLWTLCFSNLSLSGSPTAAARVQIAQQLLRLGANPNASAVKESDFGPFTATALYGSVVTRQPGLTKLLLEAGADPNDGESLYHATEPRRDPRCLGLLLQHGARPAGSNALAHALDYRNLEHVRLLLEAGADPNEVNLRGDAALHHAARRDSGPAALDLLLRHGAEIDAANTEGRTAYAIARRLGNRETAGHLLARGANDALPEADRFLAACAAGDESAARELLARDPGLVERLSAEDRALLVEAAGLHRREAVRVMLDLGFPIETKGGYDGEFTALNRAAVVASVELVELLLERGADPEAQNSYGGTALGALAWSARWGGDDMAARARGEEERQRDVVATAERLLAAGARILPQHLANASPPLAELLRRHGAEDVEVE